MTTIGRVAWAALGTQALVLSADADKLEMARRAVVSELDAIDCACSRFRDDSELTALNESGGRPMVVGQLLADAIAVALRAARLTDGAVDPTVGEALIINGYDRDFVDLERVGPPVVRLARVPGWRLVLVDRDTRRVQLPSGVRLDLGATAKALAADRAATAACQAAGCGVLVSLGGDIAVVGEPPVGGWIVRVTDRHDAPLDAEGESIRIDAGGIATSSTTVRRWIRGESEQHHLVDPDTGSPARVVWRTVSVVAATCVDANIASTASIIKGDTAPDWLAEQRLPARLVRRDGKVLRLGGWPQEEAA